MTTETHSDPIAAAIAKKRRELLTLRGELESQIKAIDKSIALLGQAVQIFDPSTKLHLDTHGIKPKRNPRTRRVLLDILREAAKPLPMCEIVDAWLVKEGLAPTPGNRRILRGRIQSALQAAKVQGIVERQGEDGWKVATERPNPAE
jgi:hypothetical protein